MGGGVTACSAACSEGGAAPRADGESNGRAVPFAVMLITQGSTGMPTAVAIEVAFSSKKKNKTIEAIDTKETKCCNTCTNPLDPQNQCWSEFVLECSPRAQLVRKTFQH